MAGGTKSRWGRRSGDLVHVYVALHCVASHHVTNYITLHYITLHYITLHYITLHYITLHCIHTWYMQCTCIYIYIYDVSAKGLNDQNLLISPMPSPFGSKQQTVQTILRPPTWTAWRRVFQGCWERHQILWRLSQGFLRMWDFSKKRLRLLRLHRLPLRKWQMFGQHLIFRLLLEDLPIIAPVGMARCTPISQQIPGSWMHHVTAPCRRRA